MQPDNQAGALRRASRRAPSLGPAAVRGLSQPEAALAALIAGADGAGYAAADRWIRLGAATVENLLMRAEAARRLNCNQAAQNDLSRARELAPLDARVHARRLDFGAEAERAGAAEALLMASRRDARRALVHLGSQSQPPAGGVFVRGRTAWGWAIWRPGDTAQLRFLGASEIRLAPPARHAVRIASLGAIAVTFRVAAPEPSTSFVALEIDGRLVSSAPMRAIAPQPQDASADAVGAEVTIVTPVFADLEATKACLHSALDERARTPGARLVVVDDAAPDPRLAAFVADLAHQPGVRLLRNDANQGFVGAVNRALAAIPQGDVLLLNADTRLPPGALRRFREAASLDPAIGILNPLSNHGEFVSYPKPFRFNAFDERDWLGVDAAAAEANRGWVVDIPSGTGFCLYVTRRCLDQVGALSPEFREGYLEDADFGLRARAAGFRNVCAPTIFVPHLGSRSFGSAKRELVARNRLTLARRFPGYEDECDAFLIADPLAPARARLERARAPARPRGRLLLVPERLTAALRRRGAHWREQATPTVLVSYAGIGSRLRLVARAFGEDAPQSAVCDSGRGWEDFLRAWRCERIELTLDAQGLDDFGAQVARRFVDLDFVVAGPVPPARLRAALGAGRPVSGLDGMSRAYLAEVFAGERPAAEPARARVKSGRLAILLPHETADSLRLMLTLSAAARRRGVGAVVFGASVADHRLIADGHIVTGPMAAEDYAASARAYGVAAYLLPYRDGSFFVLEQAWEAQNLPGALFDWSQGGYRAGAEDLALDPAAPDEAAAAAVLPWAEGAGT